LQKRVRFFHLVPERKVVLRELESVELMLSDHGGPQRIEAGEQPAAAARLLICDALDLDLVAKKLIVSTQDVAIECQFLYAVVRHGVVNRSCRRVHLKGRLDLANHVLRQTAFLRRCRRRRTKDVQ
jgi:hypothetical protein